jgi:large subunit ribosomal protein L22
MEAKAQAKYLHISARKARLVADAIRGMKVGEALNKLKFTPKKAAVFMTKVLNSAVANASQRPGVDVDKLIVKTAYVDEGPTQKRWRARAMGRAFPIRKRSSHITVVVAEK